MKVASLQLDIIKNDKFKNLEKISKLIGDESYDLIVLPELFSTGYFYENIEDIKVLAEEVPNGFTTNELVEIAKEKNTAIVGNILEKENDQLFITSLIVTPHGYIGKYRKMGLTDWDKNFYTRGDASYVFEYKGVKIGILICFDGWFPEISRELVKKGAQIILQSAMISNPNSFDIMRVRALENNCYVVVSNACSSETFRNEKISFRGESRIFDLNGDILISAEKKETIISFEINTDLNKHKTLPDTSDLIKEINLYKSF